MHDAGRHVDGERDLRLLEHRAQAGDDLVGRFPQVELAPVGVAAIDGDLLERLHQLAGTLQVGHQLIGGVAAAFEELVEPRTPQRPGIDLPGEIVAPAGEARRHREADADRDCSPRAPRRRPGRRARRASRPRSGSAAPRADPRAPSRRAPWRRAARSRPCAWRWHSRGIPRPRAPFRRSRRALAFRWIGMVVFLRHDRMHRGHDLLERQDDAARDQHADHDDRASGTRPRPARRSDRCRPGCGRSFPAPAARAASSAPRPC